LADTRHRLKTVLVVDDDGDMRFMLRILLERGGYQVTEAGDGQAALLSIKATMPDLVVTDMRMPRMDGGELMEKLRSDEATAGLPIILITAYAVLPVTSELADAMIPKPFAPERVVSTVTNLLGGRRASDRHAAERERD
jgi:CheY-like chemotaxis protein